MSDLQAKQQAAEALREALNSRPVASNWLLVLGVVYPAAVIAFELATRWCAEAFFDPMPTLWHTAAIAAVPAANLALWLALRGQISASPRWLAAVVGLSIGIAAFYALVFLPLLPLAVVGIIIYGLGLLPLGPLVSLLSALRFASLLRRSRPGLALGRPLAAGIASGLALLVALDVPAAATRLGLIWAASHEEATQKRGFSLLRALGDEDLLLRLCYESAGRPSGLLSGLVTIASSGALDDVTMSGTSQVREIYYRVHGEPFNARPAPFKGGAWTRFSDFQWDADQGSAQVGGRVKGLDLVASRIDGRVMLPEAVAYVEWTAELHNVSASDREARLQLALPPGAVVSRATLWINGEEREAAYGGRGAVRAAYEAVVRQRRDPLLVTTKGADRVLAQAFPIPREGGTLRFKIGITAPLQLGRDGSARVVLPAIVDRNFSFAPSLAHDVWIESKAPLAMDAQGLEVRNIGGGLHRVSGALSDAALALRPAITSQAAGAVEAIVESRAGGRLIRQQRAVAANAVPEAVMIVVDGSARLAKAAPHVAAALRSIPFGVPVGLAVAGESSARLAIEPWSAERLAAADRLLRETQFMGGQDNAVALAAAIQELEGRGRTALVWVHGPQPIVFRQTSGRLEQAVTRASRLPDLWLYATVPASNELLPDVAWTWRAASIPGSGAVTADLAAFLDRLLHPGEAITLIRTEVAAEPSPTTPVPAEGSEHVARLWARDRILDLMRQDTEANRAAATELATQMRLVTPVSGAVVLETQQQYAQSGLEPVGKSSVPTVPEPEEWLLIILAALGFLWLVGRSGGGRQAHSPGAAA